MTFSYQMIKLRMPLIPASPVCTPQAIGSLTTPTSGVHMPVAITPAGKHFSQYMNFLRSPTNGMSRGLSMGLPTTTSAAQSLVSPRTAFRQYHGATMTNGADGLFGVSTSNQTGHAASSGANGVFGPEPSPSAAMFPLTPSSAEVLAALQSGRITLGPLGPIFGAPSSSATSVGTAGLMGTAASSAALPAGVNAAAAADLGAALGLDQAQSAQFLSVVQQCLALQSLSGVPNNGNGQQDLLASMLMGFGNAAPGSADANQQLQMLQMAMMAASSAAPNNAHAQSDTAVAAAALQALSNPAHGTMTKPQSAGTSSGAQSSKAAPSKTSGSASGKSELMPPPTGMLSTSHSTNPGSSKLGNGASSAPGGGGAASSSNTAVPMSGVVAFSPSSFLASTPRAEAESQHSSSAFGKGKPSMKRVSNPRHFHFNVPDEMMPAAAASAARPSSTSPPLQAGSASAGTASGKAGSSTLSGSASSSNSAGQSSGSKPQALNADTPAHGTVAPAPSPNDPTMPISLPTPDHSSSASSLTMRNMNLNPFSLTGTTPSNSLNPPPLSCRSPALATSARLNGMSMTPSSGLMPLASPSAFLEL